MYVCVIEFRFVHMTGDKDSPFESKKSSHKGVLYIGVGGAWIFKNCPESEAADLDRRGSCGASNLI